MKLVSQLIGSVPLSTTLAGHFLRVLGVLVALGWHANANTTVISVDNQDPGLKYSGGWSPIPTSRESSGVNMLTRVAGAKVTYAFSGIGIAVIGDKGTQGGNATVSTYSIDGGPTSIYRVDLNPPEMQFHVTFYDTGSTLSNGPHTLTITSLNNQAWYWLDFLQVTTADPPPTSPVTTTTSLQVTTDVPQSTSSGTTSTPTASSTISNVTTNALPSTSSGTTTNSSTASSTISTSATLGASAQAATESSSTQAAPAPSKSSVITAGALAGIVLGGVTLFGLFIGGGIFWLRRRRRKRLLLAANVLPGSSGSGEDLMSSRQVTAQGYPVPYRVEAFSGSGYLDGRTQQGATREKGGGNATFFADSAQTGGTIESVPFSAPSAATQPQSLNPLSAPPSSSGTQVSSDVTRTAQIRRVSTDGGVRIAGGPPGVDIDDEEVDDSMTLPPVYRQY